MLNLSMTHSSTTPGRTRRLITEIQRLLRSSPVFLRSILNPLKILWSRTASKCTQAALRLRTTLRQSSSLKLSRWFLPDGMFTGQTLAPLDPRYSINSPQWEHRHLPPTMSEGSLTNLSPDRTRPSICLSMPPASPLLPASNSRPEMLSDFTGPLSQPPPEPLRSSTSTSYEKRSQRGVHVEAAKEIPSGGIQAAETRPIDLQVDFQNEKEVNPNTSNGHNTALVVNKTIGAVVFFGNSEKLHSKSLQFRLPIQFFLPFRSRPDAGKRLHVKPSS